MYVHVIHIWIIECVLIPRSSELQSTHLMTAFDPPTAWSTENIQHFEYQQWNFSPSKANFHYWIATLGLGNFEFECASGSSVSSTLPGIRRTFALRRCKTENGSTRRGWVGWVEKGGSRLPREVTRYWSRLQRVSAYLPRAVQRVVTPARFDFSAIHHFAGSWHNRVTNRCRASGHWLRFRDRVNRGCVF